MRSSFYRPQLDVARFLAFFAVFIHHVFPRNGGSPALDLVANASGYGLSLFFVLSAYLISLILLREYETTGLIYLRDFYMRRVLRIWPLYLAGLGIGVLRAWNHGVLDQQKWWFVAALLLAGNLVPSGGILMSHLWSISVEEQFYCLLPSVGNFGRKGLLVAAAVFLLAANVVLWHFSRVHAMLDTTVWFNSFVQFEMFAFGILLATFDRKLVWAGAAASFTAVLGAAALGLFVQGEFHLKSQGLQASPGFALNAGYTLLGVSCCLFLYGIQGLPPWEPLVYLGKISYGLYVCHIPAIAIVGNRLHIPVLDALASFGLSVLFAVLSYRILELPFLRLKRRFEIVATRTA